MQKTTETNHPEHSNSTEKYGCGSFMMWGSLLLKLVRADGKMDEDKYRPVMEENLLGAAKDSRRGWSFIFYCVWMFQSKSRHKDFNTDVYRRSSSQAKLIETNLTNFVIDEKDNSKTFWIMGVEYRYFCVKSKSMYHLPSTL